MDEELFKLVEKHRKTCYNKRYCKICSIDYALTGDANWVQCDICGVHHGDYDAISSYECTCGKNFIRVCYKCIDSQPCEMIEYESVNTHDEWAEYKYIDKCCPMTKAAK